MPFRFTSEQGNLGRNANPDLLHTCWVNNTDTRYCKPCLARVGQKRNNDKSLGARRCKNKTCYVGDFCKLHMRKILNVDVRETKINDVSMSGLFAHGKRGEHYKLENGKQVNLVPVFDSEEQIAFYGGEKLTETEVEERYTKQLKDASDTEKKKVTYPYMITYNRNFKIDSACERRAGSYANDADYVVGRIISPSKTNAVITWVQGEAPRLEVKKGVKIFHGDEITVSYGLEYWKGVGEKYIKFSTKRLARNMKKPGN